jgi:hypothetical protein
MPLGWRQQQAAPCRLCQPAEVAGPAACVSRCPKPSMLVDHRSQIPPLKFRFASGRWADCTHCACSPLLPGARYQPTSSPVKPRRCSHQTYRRVPGGGRQRSQVLGLQQRQRRWAAAPHHCRSCRSSSTLPHLVLVWHSQAGLRPTLQNQAHNKTPWH